MRCFTVFETKIHDGILVINNGIGINGQLALVANGTNFPIPEMISATNKRSHQPHVPALCQIIKYADYFRFHGINSGTDFHPIIYRDEIEYPGYALVLWIIKISGPNFFNSIVKYGVKDLLGPVTNFGFVQYLFRMSNDGSNILIKRATDHTYINLTYQYGRLDIKNVH
ncbi:hypothetical protein KKC60_00495 [Patescibacteria group bacterium]|nr:hypothetical protein [Patescibacteria group bacterium]